MSDNQLTLLWAHHADIGEDWAQVTFKGTLGEFHNFWQQGQFKH